MISISQKGNFRHTDGFFKKARQENYMRILNKYGKAGVEALSEATPVRTGETAKSWSYVIKNTSKGVTISWMNSNRVDGVPIAIIIQYGHGTRNGGYVEGIDYINPALKPIFDKLAKSVWEEVTHI